jgi:hypothetical protein
MYVCNPHVFWTLGYDMSEKGKSTYSKKDATLKVGQQIKNLNQYISY